MKDTYRAKIIRSFCIVFYLLMLYKWMNGMFLYQLQPFLFYTRADFVTWLFMQTGIHQWLLNNPGGCMVFDAAFYTMPVLFLLVYQKAKAFFPFVAILMLVINLTYVQCYTLYPSTSVEGKIVWLLFPVVFIPYDEKLFILLFRGLRYFFLFFFASSGIWKIAQGGLFHIDQMSGILLQQHKEFLALSPGAPFTRFIDWFIRYRWVSYSFYLVTAMVQLSFLFGFFTTRFDKWYITIFIIFLLLDHLLMRIPYYEVAPFLLTLWFNPESHIKRSYSTS